MKNRVQQEPCGSWAVYAGAQKVQGGMTNSQAWRVLDKINGETINRQEDVQEWSFQKNATDL